MEISAFATSVVRIFVDITKVLEEKFSPNRTTKSVKDVDQEAEHYKSWIIIIKEIKKWRISQYLKMWSAVTSSIVQVDPKDIIELNDQQGLFSK